MCNSTVQYVESYLHARVHIRIYMFWATRSYRPVMTGILKTTSGIPSHGRRWLQLCSRETKVISIKEVYLLNLRHSWRHTAHYLGTDRWVSSSGDWSETRCNQDPEPTYITVTNRSHGFWRRWRPKEERRTSCNRFKIQITLDAIVRTINKCLAARARARDLLPWARLVPRPI